MGEKVERSEDEIKASPNDSDPAKSKNMSNCAFFWFTVAEEAAQARKDGKTGPMTIPEHTHSVVLESNWEQR
jgi:hypothetical protein